MAKQKGIIKLEGTIGDITFVKTKDGYLAKEKTGISGSRISTDAAFKRTRENAAEFDTAGRAGKYLRQAFRNQLRLCSDSRLTSRLTSEMMKLIKADLVNPRGERTVTAGAVSMLEGFNFNAEAPLEASVRMPWSSNIDRAAGTLSVTLPAFSPAGEIAAPGGATHFKLVSAAAAVNFQDGSFTTSADATALLPWNETTVAGTTLTCTLEAGSVHPLFLLLGVQFYQLVNGTEYALQNGSFNALAIIKVSGQ